MTTPVTSSSQEGDTRLPAKGKCNERKEIALNRNNNDVIIRITALFFFSFIVTYSSCRLYSLNCKCFMTKLCVNYLILDVDVKVFILVVMSYRSIVKTVRRRLECVIEKNLLAGLPLGGETSRHIAARMAIVGVSLVLKACLNRHRWYITVNTTPCPIEWVKMTCNSPRSHCM